ncbi:hypothetical protein K3728_06140 [Rhodobacteraceae bacterium M385]|nr:hypothetical protein K3728_06140 [Rhodobacteraceae bacterium M385]
MRTFTKCVSDPGYGATDTSDNVSDAATYGSANIADSATDTTTATAPDSSAHSITDSAHDIP